MTDERATTPEGLVEQLLTLLDIERLDTDLYRGARQPGGIGRVFGGQVIAQALQAAQRSIDDDKVAHSLHAYFMRAGDETLPILFRVVRDYDGKSFANRRVIAQQNGKAILNMIASFQSPEGGLHHQATALPDVPPPEELRPDYELRAEHAEIFPERYRAQILRPRPLEFRPCDPSRWRISPPTDPVQHSWFRLRAPVDADDALRRAILGYASDMQLLSTALLPHGIHWATHNLQSASLDHAIWFHEPFDFDDWLLYSCDSPWSGHARGFNRGRIFTRDGRLVAETAQEGLMRLRD